MNTDTASPSIVDRSPVTKKKRRKYLDEEVKADSASSTALHHSVTESSPAARDGHREVKESFMNRDVRESASHNVRESAGSVRSSGSIARNHHPHIRSKSTDPKGGRGKSKEKKKSELETMPRKSHDSATERRAKSVSPPHSDDEGKHVKIDKKMRPRDKDSSEELDHLHPDHTPIQKRREGSKRGDDDHRDRDGKRIPRTDDALEGEAERIQGLVVDDAGALFDQFEQAFGKVARDLPKPNVLLTGITGAGKSSVINAIFGQKLAVTGTGVPITQHFTKYSSEDMRVVIYDSKGLEHGQFQDFIGSTNEFFESHKMSDSKGVSADAIHVIWYIINSAHSRFEPFEETICRELFNKVPMLFILNKADISSPQDRHRLREIITDMNLPNCVGVFDVVASPQSCKVEIDECPRCHSDDIIIKRRQALMHCEACGFEQSIKTDDGLELVIASTTQALPHVVRGAFISAQSVSFKLKEQQSRHVITEFWKEYSTVRSSARLIKNIAKMMASLSLVWEFKKHGEKHVVPSYVLTLVRYGATLARDLMSGLNWKDKFSLLFRQAKVDDQLMHCSALGVLWNRCLRGLALVLFRNWAQVKEEKAKRQSATPHSKPSPTTEVMSVHVCQDLFEQTFEQFNDENLVKLELALETRGLEKVLQEEEQISKDVFLELSSSATTPNVNPRSSSRQNTSQSSKSIKKEKLK